jgi:hypothetical protein
VLINLNEAEVKFVLYAVRELAAKLEGKLSTDKIVLTVAPNQVRLTKAGRPAKKPGRKPVKKIQPEQQAA